MKRLIVCCDGTWNTPQDNSVTNVVHIARAVRPQAADGTPQVVFYDWGVGTDDKSDALSGGSLGRGLDKNITDCYRFLVHNYVPGDEIYFFGFSRGAYTARSCVGLIRNAWLLRKQHAELIPKAYHIYRTRWHADAQNARQFREPHCQQTGIRFLGVWDTVGALGIPLSLFKKLNKKRYAFHDTVISRSVENAYHALAIDEQRKPFTPTIWKTTADRERTEQCWFSGVHSDVGGGYREAGLSHIALRWLAEKASATGLEFDTHYLDSVYASNNEEQLHNSFTGAMKLLGRNKRSIGTTNGDETLHSSAEQRHLNQAKYRPKNLLEYLARDEQMRLPL